MPRRHDDKRSARRAGEGTSLDGGETLEPIMDPEAATAARDAVGTGRDTDTATAIAQLLEELGGSGDDLASAESRVEDDQETIQWALREAHAEDHVGAGEEPPADDADALTDEAALLADVADASALIDTALAEAPPDLDGRFRGQKPSKLRLGDILKDAELVTDEQVEAAMARQGETRKRLGQLLVEDGIVSMLDMTRALAQKFGVAFIDLKSTPPQSSVGDLVPEKLLRKYEAVPVKFLDDSTLLLAMSDPQNFFAQQDLELITGYAIQPAMAVTEDVVEAIGKLGQRRAQIDQNVDDLAHDAMEDESVTDIRDATEEAPIVKLVNSVIAQAVDDGASDIHFEPQAKELMTRLRIDGVLHELMSIPRRMQNGVISRLKIMADLDIAERRVPQDGRIGLIVGGKPIDMRVATLPTVYGEKIVMRLLDKSNVMLDLEDLGFSTKALKRFQRSFTRPYGAILVTGPTGSGKSTTLYAALNILNSPEKNIITVEDPVEYRLTGINQVQVNVKAGLTFAAASALDPALRPGHRDGRRDPRPRDRADRDRVGADRPPRAAHAAHERRAGRALTPDRDGHRALPDVVRRRLRARPSAWPASSARSARSRTRRPARCCARTTSLRRSSTVENVALYRPKGCSRCNGTGYKGRLGSTRS